MTTARVSKDLIGRLGLLFKQKNPNYDVPPTQDLINASLRAEIRRMEEEIAAEKPATRRTGT